MAFKNARAMVNLKSVGRTKVFGWFQKFGFLSGRLPLPESTSPKKFVGEGGVFDIPLPITILPHNYRNLCEYLIHHQSEDSNVEYNPPSINVTPISVNPL